MIIIYLFICRELVKKSEDSRLSAYKLLAKYEDNALALAYLSYLELGQGNKKKAQELLDKAHKKLEEAPQLNALAHDIIPKTLEGFIPPKYQPERIEVAPNVYAVKAPHEVDKTTSGW